MIRIDAGPQRRERQVTHPEVAAAGQPPYFPPEEVILKWGLRCSSSAASTSSNYHNKVRIGLLEKRGAVRGGPELRPLPGDGSSRHAHGQGAFLALDGTTLGRSQVICE